MAGNGFNIGDVLRFGWERYKERWVFWLGVALIVFLVGAAFNVLEKLVGAGAAAPDAQPGLIASLVGLVVVLANVYVQNRLNIGVTTVLLKAVDGATPEFRDLLAKPYLFWRYLGASILFSIVVAVGLILLVVPGIYLMLRYGYYAAAMVDREEGLRQSFETSSRITEGQRANLLLLGLTLLVINLLGAILFGLGLLITVPVSALAAIHVYRILRTAADAAQTNGL